MSRKITLTLAARRELTAVRADWTEYWAGIVARQDLHRQGLLVTSKRRAEAGDVTVMPQYHRFLRAGLRRRAAEVYEQTKASAVTHDTTVRPTDAGRFVATCTCTWSSRPLTERGAKGQGTRHVKGATVAAAA